jgi:hypothetical protein
MSAIQNGSIPNTSNTTTSIEFPREKIFTKFKDLPKEIRLLIWTFALPGPRVVYLKQYALAADVAMVRDIRAGNIVGTTSLDGIKDDRGGLDSLWGFRSPTPIPALLLACHESFEVASRSYSRQFSALGAIPQTYFDFDRDILFIDTRSFTTKAVPHLMKDGGYMFREAHLVQHLLLGTDVINNSLEPNCEYTVVTALGFFGNIKILSLAVDHYTFREEDDASDLEVVEILDESGNDCSHGPVVAQFAGGTFSLRTVKMEWYRSNWIEDHPDKVPWDIPEIRYK